MATITVPDETYQRLTMWAAAQNQTVEQAVIPVLENLAPSLPTLEQRRLAFEKLTAMVQARSHLYPAGFQVDDSRESIYEGCGE